MKIEARHVSCIEIFVGETRLGIFREEEQWNGLAALRRVTDGLLLVVASPDSSGFSRILGRMWGADEKAETYLVNGHQELIREIDAIKEAERTPSDYINRRVFPSDSC